MNEARHDHDLGLGHDLRLISMLASRRRALRWFAGAGSTALIGACDSAGSAVSGSGTVSTPTPTPSSSATATPTPTPTGSGSCVADPSETNGPYPADGTNSSSGPTSNVLTTTGVVRSDIRSSFVGSTAVAEGAAMTLTLTVVNVNAACAPLAGYAIYIWHCDAAGRYSLYDVPAESWLRGVGVTDANGQVTFTTIFPGCYSGRYPHIHFEVFSSLASATSGNYARLIGQLAMPAAECSTIYNGASAYATSVSSYARTSVASDGIFGDNSAAQIAQQTPVMGGSIAAGYTASATIGLAL
ncbi:intradiol ring-cleavage dioxygenase [Sphingomonas suaedae]|uniref:Intradiol ring-cleavage dioxygenase n=1 Tax=Sphingomonas suaedae TaxID=2599297 RepID=A0A518RJ34_9SPHN|nr:intradiol ring-cleavage dioxygenase [Sphingomonas suaedae]QDX27454.1 intradiol ring-cleavage dioxygenase [Sphingomonas suaedae]